MLGVDDIFQAPDGTIYHVNADGPIPAGPANAPINPDQLLRRKGRRPANGANLREYIQMINRS